MSNTLPAEEVHDLLGSWIRQARGRGLSTETQRSYRTSVTRFVEWSGEEVEFSRARMDEWTADLLDDGATTATVRTRQLTVRRFALWLRDEDEIHTDVDRVKPVKMTEDVIGVLTGDQVRAFLAACEGADFRSLRDTAVFTLMVETGLRASEACNLNLADVNLDEEWALIRRGKGGKDRYVSLPPKSQAAIDRWIRRGRKPHPLAKQTDALFLGDRGRGFGYFALYRALKRRASIAGVPEFHPHMLRSTFASKWLESGRNEGDLMTLAGWEDPSMVRRYARRTATDRALRSARGFGVDNF